MSNDKKQIISSDDEFMPLYSLNESFLEKHHTSIVPFILCFGFLITIILLILFIMGVIK